MNQPHYQPKTRHRSHLADFNLQDSERELAAQQAFQRGNQSYHQYLARSLKKDLEQAVQAFRQAVELEPAMAEAQVKLVETLWAQGAISLEDAIHQCRVMVELKPECAEATLFLGYFLRRAGELSLAQEAFQNAVTLSGFGAARARLSLGRVLIQQRIGAHNSSKALNQTISGLLQIFLGVCSLPWDSQAMDVLQSTLKADSQIFALTTVGRLFKLCRLSNQTIRLYEWGSHQLPQEPIFFHLLGDLQMAKGNLDAAIYYYNRCKELEPDDLLLHKKLGHAYSQCDDASNAAKSLEMLVETEAEDFDTLYTLAHIYTEQNDHIRALYYYKELLTENPDNPYLHSHIAFILFKLEDYDGAIEEYQLSLKLGRDPIWMATVAQTLGTLYYQIKQDGDSALELFQLATQLDASNLDAWTFLGDIYTEQCRYEDAIAVYRHILRQEPDNAECYNYLGYILWQLDKNDEAVAAYRKAIALNGENPIAFNNLGVIYLDEKCQLEKALKMFQQAVQLKPDYTLACFNIGRTKEALGQTTEAAQSYSDALTLNSYNPELSNEEIMERLEQLFQV